MYWLKRRSSIELIIVHLNSDHRMGINHLRHIEEDKMKDLLAACGCNSRKLLKLYLFFQRTGQTTVGGVLLLK